MRHNRRIRAGTAEPRTLRPAPDADLTSEESAIVTPSAPAGDPPTDTGTLAVELRGITKRFPGVVANHAVDLSVRQGTVHAIVGENGAGKSTLMKILYGMQRPDEGTIRVAGEQVDLATPAAAIGHGIGMVHQHFMLADNLTVLENVVLGAEKRHGIGARARQRLVDLAENYGLRIRVDALVEELGVAERQRVEILKVLYRGASTIILDEPTAVLVPQEVEALFANLRELRAEGLTVIFISHKLDEVLSVADDITVIRRGTTVARVNPGEVTARRLAELMVGSELPSPATDESPRGEEPVLHVRGLTLARAHGPAALDAVDLTIHNGEILGIAGVEGNGQSELVDTLIGLRLADGGTVTLDGADVTGWPVRRRRVSGLGYIPEDRQRHGLLLEAPLWENRILGHVTEAPARRSWGMLDPRAARADTERLVSEYDVRTPSVDVPAASLSGGNQQKLIVGRELSHQPRVLVAAHPTRGVDVGAQAQIWDQIRAARAQGMAVLLISADLDELIGLSDTLRVMLRGRLVARADPATVTPQELGSAMTGAQADEDGTVQDSAVQDGVGPARDAGTGGEA